MKNLFFAGLFIFFGAVTAFSLERNLQAIKVQQYKGNYPPIGYKVIVSSWNVFVPWGIWSSTMPVISDEVLSFSSLPANYTDWVIDNQGDGTNGYDVWSGSSPYNCITNGDRETFRLQYGKNISLDGKVNAETYWRTLQNTTNTTTLYMFLTAEEK